MISDDRAFAFPKSFIHSCLAGFVRYRTGQELIIELNMDEYKTNPKIVCFLFSKFLEFFLQKIKAFLFIRKQCRDVVRNFMIAKKCFSSEEV